MSIAKYKQISLSSLKELVVTVTSYSELMRKLGYKGMGIQPQLKSYLEENGIDTSHFKGHAWNKGLSQVKENRPKKSQINSFKKRLIQERGHQCEQCKNINWLDKPIPLQLHHIDGNHYNNNLNNLQLLCPNCHALTDTYCGKNRRKYNISDEDFLIALNNTASINAACKALGIPANESNYRRARQLLHNR